MKTAIDWLLNNLPERYRNAMLNTCQEEIKQARQKEREQMIGFHRWMLKTDTADNAEEFFHYTDEDMLEQYLNGDYGPGWRDLSEPLEVSTQDPAVYTKRDNTTIEDIHKIHKEMMDKEEGLISTSDNTTEWTSEVRNGITIHQSKPKKDI